MLGSFPGVGSLVLFCISIWLLVTMVVAVRQALDYSSTPRAVGVCLVAQFLSGLLLFLFVAP